MTEHRRRRDRHRPGLDRPCCTSPPAGSDLPGAMFTASHNPAKYNGIKMCRAGAAPVGADSGPARHRRPGRQAPHRRPAAAPRRARSPQKDLLDRVRRPPARPRRPDAASARSRWSSTPATAWAGTPSRPCSPPAPVDDRPAVLRAGRQLPEPRGQPAGPEEPGRPAGQGARGRRRPRPGLRRRRGPLLRGRRVGRPDLAECDHRRGRGPRAGQAPRLGRSSTT